MTIKNKLSYSADEQRYWHKRMSALTFSKTVRAHRLAEGWSLNYAAEKIGISKQQMSDYENGRKIPGIEKAYQIAKALDMMPQSLVLLVINEQLRKADIPIQVEVAS